MSIPSASTTQSITNLIDINGSAGTGTYNIVIGDGLRLLTTGDFNTAIGLSALLSDLTGGYNVSVGYETMKANTTGYNNTAIGYQALALNTMGFNNVCIGYQAGKALTIAQGNVAIGVTALLNTTSGDYNTAIGVDALYTNILGYSNTAIGADALGFNINGHENVAVGFNALFANTNGNNNTAIGFRALKSNLTGTNNVAVGNFAGAYELGSNAFYIDNQDRTNTAGDKAKALVYGVFNANPALQTLAINAVTTIGIDPGGANTLRVNGSIRAKDASGIIAFGGSEGGTLRIARNNTGSGQFNFLDDADAFANVIVGKFGANGNAAQAKFASGGALNAYGAGANGLDTGANMSALHAMVVAIRAALVANGIMS
jgi:hypothetical protein